MTKADVAEAVTLLGPEVVVVAAETPPIAELMICCSMYPAGRLHSVPRGRFNDPSYYYENNRSTSIIPEPTLHRPTK